MRFSTRCHSSHIMYKLPVIVLIILRVDWYTEAGREGGQNTYEGNQKLAEILSWKRKDKLSCFYKCCFKSYTIFRFSFIIFISREQKSLYDKRIEVEMFFTFVDLNRILFSPSLSPSVHLTVGQPHKKGNYFHYGKKNGPTQKKNEKHYNICCNHLHLKGWIVPKK